MTTTFQRTNPYPADPAAVYAMLLDPAFHERVCEQQGALGFEVTVAGTPPVITIRQQQSLDGAPDLVRKIAGGSLDVVQVETWTSPTTATLSITIPGKPGSLQGTIALTPSATGTDERFDATIKASIPLVGGKLEGIIAAILGSGLKRRAQVGASWLTETE